MQLAGSITGQRVIDLACGKGYFTRLLKQKGVASIFGVDVSKGMIELALAEERKRPLDIEYRVPDVRDLKVNVDSDLAFAVWLLNCATDTQQLLRMGQAIAGLLKPGGRFVTINTNPDDPISKWEDHTDSPSTPAFQTKRVLLSLKARRWYGNWFYQKANRSKSRTITCPRQP